MEQQERKRRALLNKEIKAFAEKIAEAASVSVRSLILYPLGFSHHTSNRMVTHWSSTFHLGNSRSKEYHSGPAPVSSRLLSVSSTLLIRHSWL